MYIKYCGGYDEIPADMDRYLNMYGPHFNKKLSEEAAKRMYTVVNGKRQYIQPYTKEQVEALLKANNVQLERDVLYDSVYIANMVKADFLGRAVPNEQCLAKYIKDAIDDPDAESGYIFNRFYGDCMFMNMPIEWEDML